MPRELDLDEVFALDAADLVQARQKMRTVHASKNLTAAGNEVEMAVRDYLRRMLPPRYYVTHGHLIDTARQVSPQLDIIIADQFVHPSLLTTQDGTEYVPATSALAIGEIKSTYSNSRDDYTAFHDKLVTISELHRPLVVNSIYGGLQGSSDFRDLVLQCPNKHLNNLYAFLLCIDAGDFDFQRIRSLLQLSDVKNLPNRAVFLNTGIIAYASRTDLGRMHSYPNECPENDYDWCFFETTGPEHGCGSVEGANLALLYGDLISHLSVSYLEPPPISEYIGGLRSRRSTLMWASH